MKNKRPLTDFTWLCHLDMAKGLDIGQTYLNNKAAFRFIKAIAVVQSKKTVDMINSAPFFSIMMDSSTDITGDEQDSVYARLLFICLKIIWSSEMSFGPVMSPSLLDRMPSKF